MKWLYLIKAVSNNPGICGIYRLAVYLGRKAKLQESSEAPRAFGSDITSCVFLARALRPYTFCHRASLFRT